MNTMSDNQDFNSLMDSPEPDYSQHPLLADLTEAQRNAVITTEGPVLVLAAAGSGKTRVITRRVAWLISEVGIPPWSILAITFTNKAAGEMKERIGGLLDDGRSGQVHCSTFHSFCARMLRIYADRANLPADYSIYDTTDQKKVITDVYKSLDISKEHFAPRAFASTISNAKNQMIDAGEFAARAQNFYEKQVAKIYQAYEDKLLENKAVDFDDLLLRMAYLLRDDAEVREDLQNKFQYIMIDEYQDTNQVQFTLARLLADSHRNICVVGDPDQSIYGWRGADIRNILDFETHYEEATTIALGQNYRSTPEILQLADTIIRNNKQRKHKDLWTENKGGNKIQLIQTGGEESEGQNIIDWFKDLKDKGAGWQHMAIFYRTNALSRTLEEVFLRNDIPYQIARGTAFYQRKEIKDAIAYLKALMNPADDVALLRIINTPTRGIGNKTIQQCEAYAAMQGKSLYEAFQSAGHVPGLTSRAVNSIDKFLYMIDQWHNVIEEADTGELSFEQKGARDVIEMILKDSKLEDFYRKDDEEKLENLYELVSAAQRFDEEYGEEDANLRQRMRDYLESVSLVADVDAVENSSGAVTLMTLHAAKGLEFDHVAIIGLEEGLLPHGNSFDAPEQIEEERRLLFVGITRARKELMLTHARNRTVRGLRERTIPSTFISEMPGEIIIQEDRSGVEGFGVYDDARHGDGFGGGSFGGSSSSGGSTNAFGLSKGMLVRHPQFGSGRIISLAGKGKNMRARIEFATVGIKTLVLEYARLQIIE